MFDVVTFLTDFGTSDTFVGVCHAVLARTAPHARVIDLTHDVAPQAVVQGALLLARAVPYAPPSVHLAVVDPGVGSERRGIAVVTGRGDVLVGPDNGLLMPAARALDGVVRVSELADGSYRLHPTSRTFHGRDVFAPAAGAIAAGVDPSALGPAVRDLRDLELPASEPVAGGWRSPVVLVDRFGNCQLAPGLELPAAPTITVEEREVPVVATFADLDGGQLGAYVDSDGAVALAVRGGSAAALLGLAPGDVVTVRTDR